jgi:transcription-repair coupling factor (superfamily II helicase)
MDKALFGALWDTGPWQRLEECVRGGQMPCSAFGVSENRVSHMAPALAAKTGRPVLVVVNSDIRAMRLAEDISAMTGVECPVFPPRPSMIRKVAAASREILSRRLSVLASALQGKAPAVVATVEALAFPLAPPQAFVEGKIQIAVGQQIDPKGLAARLSMSGYTREERAEGPGQFAVRGGLLDVFPQGAELPARLEFYGDEVEMIRLFDAWTQRSEGEVKALDIFPATEVPLTQAALESGAEAMRRALDMTKAELKKKLGGGAKKGPGGYGVASQPGERLAGAVEEYIEKLLTGGAYEGIENHLPFYYGQTAMLWDFFESPLVVLDEPNRLKEALEEWHKEYEVEFAEAEASGEAFSIQGKLASDWEGFASLLPRDRLLSLQDLTRASGLKPRETVEFTGHDSAGYRGKFEMLANDLRRWRREGWRVLMLAGSDKRAQRMADTLVDLGLPAVHATMDRHVEPGEIVVLSAGLRQGFEDPEEKFALLGEADVFGASRQRKKVVQRSSKRKMDLFADLKAGDFVVHETHGIGVFRGVVKLTADGQTRDYMDIEYRGSDRLYVPTELMDRVEKYIGAEGSPPKVNRLGGAEWEHAKNRVREKVAGMAEELIRLYASREAAKGFQYAPDDDTQRMFEESFPYEETPDQVRSIADIKRDMESGRVMDRLLCGDVGYGKTEVALRAAFKAVMSGKQVALLAPTTVLAYQHYNTMTERFGGSGVRCEMLSRFRSAAEQEAIIRKLREKELDAVVGTHRLLSKDVKFADLGLLVVDEEQRFGVAHKERIKQLKASVDVLTMTATPIPRTLHMSLSGIRDISTIETPPEERQPVQTYVIEYHEGVIRDAILKEMGRGGQVYFLYNRVDSMPMFHRRLQELVPEARIAVGHGQMPDQELENVMVSFYHGEYDILLSTTIIENGLDIPRVNTLIVYDADKFGLSQLYQLRGRVGRSNRLAFAYFTYRRDQVLSEVAEKRLTAIREFTEFGSGFKIAMRDLEIRGAGNLLGEEQHGHMAAVGYALYCRLIDEAVRRLKGEDIVEETEVRVDVKVDAHIPDGYIPDMMGRLEAYRRIAEIENETHRRDVIDELIDRYGEPPPSVLNLMDVAELKALAARAQAELVQMKGAELHLKFSPGAALDLGRLIAYINAHINEMSLTAAKQPVLVVRRMPARWKDFFAYAKAVLGEISLCNTAANSV